MPESGPTDHDLLSGGHRKERRGFAGCLAVLLALAVIGGGLWFGGSKAYDWLQETFEGAPADYAGPGSGEVAFEVKEGDSATVIGQNLEKAGVVQSTEAFIEAANANPDSASIQVGHYVLRKRMKATDAVELLADPKNLVQDVVTIPEGLRVTDIVKRLADQTDFKAGRFERVLDRPKQIGLPAHAQGNPEGYLFPATYAFAPNATPREMLTEMVDRWKQAAGDNDLTAAAEQLGLSPHEVMTAASLIQNEGRRAQDLPKIARVIYNRIENPSEQGTGGRLQIDASVDYALDRPLTVGLTQEERENTDSPYNTYTNPGLPPGPISSPGDDAIQAALHPADGDWYFYVAVNLRTGETKFAETYDEFLGYRDELREYCDTESQGAC